MRKRGGSGWNLSKLPVLEVFGPTIQGEGMVTGQKTMFIRTAGCDYACSWCDSAFTWDGSAKDDIKQMTPEQIWQSLKEAGGVRFSHVTISGGNPALYPQMGDFVRLLHEQRIDVALETQGSRWQDWFVEVDDLTLSPKPPSSNMTADFEKLDLIVARLIDAGRQAHVSQKIVVFDEADYDFAKQAAKRYPQLDTYLQTGNPDVETADDEKLRTDLLSRYEALVDRVMADEEMNDVRVLPQLHTLLWGNMRGV